MEEPHMSDNQSPYPPAGPPQPGQPLPGQPLPGQPVPGQPLPGQPGAPFGAGPSYPAPAAPAATFSGVAIAGFILAIVAAPIGFILSIVGLIMASRPGRKGKGLAIAGIIISLLISGGVVAIVVAVANSNLSTVADPGCLAGKAAITDNVDKLSSGDPRPGFTATIEGLRDAADKAEHDSVRDAMTGLADAYDDLVAAMETGDIADELHTNLETRAAEVDRLCTLGG